MKMSKKQWAISIAGAAVAALFLAMMWKPSGPQAAKSPQNVASSSPAPAQPGPVFNGHGGMFDCNPCIGPIAK
jgi:hypothetical protein